MQKFGIDVSHWQGDFNLAKAKADEGVEFAILKIGGGDNGLYKDSQFENNYKKCVECGLDKGVYFFGHAMNMEQAESETAYLLELLKGKQLEYPVFYDVEADMLTLDTRSLTDICKYVLSTVQSAGWWAGIYTSESHFNAEVIDSELTAYSHWAAKYSSEKPRLTSGAEVQMWQYGGTKNEIRSNLINGQVVDQNYCYIDYPAKIKANGLNGYAKNSEGLATSQTGTKLPTVTAKPDVIYAIKTAANGWLPEVKNTEDYAGIENRAAVGVMIRLSDGTPLKYRVHTTAGKWLGWVTGYNKNDYYNGYAGDDRTPIDAVEIKCDKYTIMYKVSSVQGGGAYYPDVSDNTVSGSESYAGVFGKPVDKFMAWIE